MEYFQVIIQVQKLHLNELLHLTQKNYLLNTIKYDECFVWKWKTVNKTPKSDLPWCFFLWENLLKFLLNKMTENLKLCVCFCHQIVFELIKWRIFIISCSYGIVFYAYRSSWYHSKPNYRWVQHSWITQ